MRNLGIPDAMLDGIDSDVISLEGLGISDEDLAEFNLNPDAPITVPTLPMLGFDVPNQEELIVAATEALSSINLNTLGQDVDEQLGEFGLQLRQGEVYLNELGALQLNARAGDLLEDLHRTDSSSLSSAGGGLGGGSAGRGTARGHDAHGRGTEAALHAGQGQQHTDLKCR